MRVMRKKEWFDNESFWRELYPFMFTEKRFQEAVVDTEEIITLVKPSGKNILDLCCGPGRYSLAFVKKGYKVTGVDRTVFLLAKARARASAARAKIEWVKQDMRDFVRPESFDLVLSMYTSFGYFDNKQEDVLVLKNVLASLRPGGKFIIDTLGKERLARIYDPTVSSDGPDGSILVMRHEAINDWTQMKNDWILIRRGRAKTFSFQHRLFSGQELKELLTGAGFVDVRLYGSFDGDKFGPYSVRLIAVGVKPRTGKRSRR